MHEMSAASAGRRCAGTGGSWEPKAEGALSAAMHEMVTAGLRRFAPDRSDGREMGSGTSSGAGGGGASEGGPRWALDVPASGDSAFGDAEGLPRSSASAAFGEAAFGDPLTGRSFERASSVDSSTSIGLPPSDAFSPSGAFPASGPACSADASDSATHLFASAAAATAAAEGRGMDAAAEGRGLGSAALMPPGGGGLFDEVGSFFDEPSTTATNGRGGMVDQLLSEWINDESSVTDILDQLQGIE